MLYYRIKQGLQKTSQKNNLPPIFQNKIWQHLLNSSLYYQNMFAFLSKYSDWSQVLLSLYLRMDIGKTKIAKPLSSSYVFDTISCFRMFLLIKTGCDASNWECRIFIRLSDFSAIKCVQTANYQLLKNEIKGPESLSFPVCILTGSSVSEY